MPYRVTEECILCGACVAGCPVGAIEEGETQSHIDITVCIECGTCEQNCPVSAIIWEDPDEGGASEAKADKPVEAGASG